jgi:hypothetical protein
MQIAVVTKAFWKTWLSLARESILGVLQISWPANPKVSWRKSSTRRKRMLGFEPEAKTGAQSTKPRTNVARARRRGSLMERS